MIQLIKFLLFLIVVTSADDDEIAIASELNNDKTNEKENNELNNDKTNEKDNEDNQPSVTPKDEQGNKELKNQFNSEMLAYFNSDKTKNISFEMDHTQYVRKSAINKKQIDYLIDLLTNNNKKNKKKEDKNFYNYKKNYYVKKIGDSFELRAIINQKKMELSRR